MLVKEFVRLIAHMGYIIVDILSVIKIKINEHLGKEKRSCKRQRGR